MNPEEKVKDLRDGIADIRDDLDAVVRLADAARLALCGLVEGKFCPFSAGLNELLTLVALRTREVEENLGKL